MNLDPGTVKAVSMASLNTFIAVMCRVVTMHRCIAILGPSIRVLYRDLSIAIRIRDQCIAIRDTYHDPTSGATHVSQYECPYHRRLGDLFKNNQAHIL